MQEPVMLDITVGRREKLVEYVIHSAEPDPIDAMPCLTVNGIDDIIISCRSCKSFCRVHHCKWPGSRSI